MKTPSTEKPDKFALAQAAGTLGVSEAYLKEELNGIGNQIKATDLREYERQLEKQREAAMQKRADVRNVEKYERQSQELLNHEASK